MQTDYKIRKDQSDVNFTDWLSIGVTTILGCLGYSIYKNFVTIEAIGGYTISLITAILLKKKAPAVFTNNTDVPVYVKDEYSDEVSIVMPGTKTAVLDGFKYRGKLYKISNGVHATLNADGTVSYKNWLHKNLQQSQGEEYIFKAGEGWGELNEANEEELKTITQ